MIPTPCAKERQGKQTHGSTLTLSKYVNGWNKDGTKTETFPTPNAYDAIPDYGNRKDSNIEAGGRHGVSLRHLVKTWPTPIANDALKRGDFDPVRSPGLAASVKQWPTPQTRGYTNQGDLMLLAKSADTKEEFSAMAYRAGNKKTNGVWQTPRVTDGSKGDLMLPSAVKNWPTPKYNDYKGSVSTEKANERSELFTRGVDLSEEITKRTGECGQLNPNWVEWLMGWPIGWTDIKPLRKARYRGWLENTERCTWWDSDPANNGVPRVATGIKHRVDRLKAIGNGQVPAVAAMAWEILKKKCRHEKAPEIAQGGYNT